MTSARFLILQTGEAVEPVARQGPGFIGLFKNAIATAGLVTETRVLDARRRNHTDPLPPLDDIAGVIVTGSAGMVDENAGWMRYSIRLIKRILDDEKPFLGVCFGHQLLGVACAADVGPNPRGRMMGSIEVTRRGDAPSVSDDGILARHPPRFWAQVSHRDVIRDPGARLQVMASAEHDAVHAVRAGPWAWGVQYHPEFTVETMRGYIDARRSVYDADKGAGAADAALAHVKDTPDARATVAEFVRVAHAKWNRDA
jgi:GMP synthase (glutamine-hydrolysing)